MGSLLKVSDAASIGMHAACLLSQSPGEVLTAKEMATRLDVSETHLAKVMNRLQKAGLVKSILGPGGGFALARSAKKITLFEVLQSIDGPTGDTACLFSPARCEGGGCVIGSISAEVNELVSRRMGSLSLAEVASDSTQLTMMPIKRIGKAPRAKGTSASRGRRGRR